MSVIGDVIDRFGEIAPEDTVRLARVIVILTCSDALRLWYNRFDVDADEVADHVVWTIRTLLTGRGR